MSIAFGAIHTDLGPCYNDNNFPYRRNQQEDHSLRNLGHGFLILTLATVILVSGVISKNLEGKINPNATQKIVIASTADYRTQIDITIPYFFSPYQ
jgi:hypothetical protein